MKLLRNPIVVALLAVAAIVVVVYQSLGDKLLRGRFAASRPSAASLTPVAPVDPANSPGAKPSATPLPPGAIPLSSPPRTTTYTNLETALLPAQGVESAAVEKLFPNWIVSPLRDPFLLFKLRVDDPASLAAATNSPVPSWVLNAIWNQTDSRLAVINNRVCRVGDTLDAGYKLIRIEKDEVWFQGPQTNERLGFDHSKARSAKGAPGTGAPKPGPSAKT